MNVSMMTSITCYIYAITIMDYSFEVLCVSVSIFCHFNLLLLQV